MSKIDMERLITEAVKACADGSGWANLAEIGAYLRQQGIGYKKLSYLLHEYPQVVRTKADTSLKPPAIYAKLVVREETSDTNI